MLLTYKNFEVEGRTILKAMDSFNSSNLSFSGNNSTVPPLSIPLEGLVAYYLFFLLFIIIPVIVLNALILLALLVDRSTVGTVRLVLCNIPAACLMVGITAFVYDIAGVALAFTDIGSPERIIQFCRASLFFIGTGGAARFLFLAAFSVTVYYIVKFHMVNKEEANRRAFIGFAVAVVVLWVMAILGGTPVMFDTIVSNSCRYTAFGGSINVALFVFIFGIGGFATSITFLLLTVFYIRKHSISGADAPFKKALVKLGFFLLIGNVINFIGQIVPPIIGAAVNEGGDTSSVSLIAIYFALILIDLSLIPTPILLIIYFKPVRMHLKKWLCCCCNKKAHALEGGSGGNSATTKDYGPSHVSS